MRYVESGDGELEAVYKIVSLLPLTVVNQLVPGAFLYRAQRCVRHFAERTAVGLFVLLLTCIFSVIRHFYLTILRILPAILNANISKY